MILNGKCKLDFYKFINKDIPDKESFECEMNINDLNYKSKTELNALIIEWFDSLGIIINVKRYVMPLGEVEWYFIITGDNGAHLNNHVSEESRSVLDCRKNITEKAIKKANEIYNTNN